MVESRQFHARHVLAAVTVFLCWQAEPKAVAVSFIGETRTPHFFRLPAAGIEALKAALDGLFANPDFNREWVGEWMPVEPA